MGGASQPYHRVGMAANSLAASWKWKPAERAFLDFVGLLASKS